MDILYIYKIKGGLVMDYSVEGYLRRRTEEELEQILKEFIQKREDQYYEMWIEICNTGRFSREEND